MKRRGRKYDRWTAHPFRICTISATLIFILTNISAKEVTPLSSRIKDVNNVLTNKEGEYGERVNNTEKSSEQSSEESLEKFKNREYVYIEGNDVDVINKEDYYYYYEDEFYDDVEEDLYHLETAKNNKTKGDDAERVSVNDIDTNNVKVVIDVGGEMVRKERDYHHANHIFPHNPISPPDIPLEQHAYSTGWVVIPQPLGNYVHQSTTPAPPALQVKHKKYHRTVHHHNQNANGVHPLVPVTTVATITTTQTSLPTPTNHVPFHNFPKYREHQTHYVPKNVYVQDQPYDTVEVSVTETPSLHTLGNVNEIVASTKVNVHHHDSNVNVDSRRPESEISAHKLLDEVYHFHPHHQPVPTIVPGSNNYLAPPTHPTPSYHHIATTSPTVASTTWSSYYRHQDTLDSTNHIHYNPYVKYPQTTTTTASNPNEDGRRPQRDYFPAPKIIGVLEDEGATTLLDLIEKANLTEFLNNRDATFTVFAPTNEAFAKLDPNLVRTLTEDNGGDFDLLRSVLLYHLVPRKIYTRNFNDDTTLETALIIETDEDIDLNENDKDSVKDDTDTEDQKDSGNGKTTGKERKKEKRQLRVTRNEGNGVVTINGAHVDIEESDQTASNGVIHFIEEVIYPIPTGSVFETLSRDNRFSILVDLLEAAELGAALNTSSADPVTIFAPTDDAFLKLPRSGLEEIVEDKQAVTDLLFNHVTKSTKLSPDLTFRTFKSFTRGNDIVIQVRKGQVYVGAAKLIDGDIITTNGVIQVIDTVLL